MHGRGLELKRSQSDEPMNQHDATPAKLPGRIQSLSFVRRGTGRAAVRRGCRHHLRRAAVSGSHLQAERRTALLHRRRRPAGQRDFHVVCRPAGRLAGTPHNDGIERHSVRRQHSDDCAGPGLRGACVRPVAAGHQRGIYRRGDTALSGRMPRRGGPRQGHGNFSMVADAWHCRRRLHRFVLQQPCRGGRKTGQCRPAFCLQGSCVAEYFLGVAAAGNFVCPRLLPGRRVAALALSSGQEGSRPRRPAPVAQRCPGGN